MFTRARTWWVALALVVMLGGVGLLIVTLGRAPAPTPLPNPNGYDDFLKAAAVTSGNIGDYRTLGQETLRDLVTTNAESLRLLRLGLTRQCSVPTEAAMTNLAGMATDLAGMKRLAQLLAAEGRLRELDNQPAEAVQSYLDAIRFGNETSRGGFIINRLVGIAVEAIGYVPLAKLAPGLKPEEARRVIGELEKCDNTHITWDEVLRHEKSLFYHEIRKYSNPVIWVQSLWTLRPARQRAAGKHKRIVAQERLLAAELALRCYLADKARVPARLEDLVPDYLAKVPQDPFTGQAMIYRPQGTNWLVYSVGEDGVDNGGRPVARGLTTPGDLLYNLP